MILIFSPVRMDETLTLSRAGDAVTLNGATLDFGPLPEGGVLSAGAIGSPWIAGDVTRTGGVLTVPLILPHGANAPEQTRFPQPMVVTEDGPIVLPGWGEDVASDVVAVIDGQPMNAAEYDDWQRANGALV